MQWVAGMRTVTNDRLGRSETHGSAFAATVQLGTSGVT
jgi:hypothetical protein